MPSGSSGSSSKTCSPVRKALPSTSVTTAGVPATSASPTTRPRNSEPTMLRWRSSSPRRSRPLPVEQREPRRGAAAARRAVHLAVGEHRDVPLCERPLALVLPEDDPVHVAQLGLERMDDVVLGFERALELPAELDQPRKLPWLDPLLDGGVERAAERDVDRPAVHVEALAPTRTTGRFGTEPSGHDRPRRAPTSRAGRRERPRRRASLLRRARRCPRRAPRSRARSSRAHMPSSSRRCGRRRRRGPPPRRSARRRSSRTCPHAREARRRAADGRRRAVRGRPCACRGSSPRSGGSTPPVTIRKGSPPVW